MRSGIALSLVGLLVCGSASASVTGKYVEARNAAMWAGPCLTNSEMGLVGDQATLAWKVTAGDYEGVALDDLAIVAVVVGDRTFGMGEKVNTRTILVVDERASDQQQTALIAMAKALAGETIQEVLDVKRAAISMEVADDGSAFSLVDAGIVRINTRRLHRSDSLCGTDNTRMVYPALAKITDEQSAYALENTYSLRGSQLSVRQYEDRNTPSAVIGSFSL